MKVTNITKYKKIPVTIEAYTFDEMKDLEETGLEFNNEEELLFGNPLISGDLKLKLLYKIYPRTNILKK